MAVTAYQKTEMKPSTNGERIVAVPLAASQKVYGGTIGYIGFDGYLYNASASIRGARAVIVIDENDNSSGSAGDKVSKVYFTGRVKLPCTAVARTNLNQVMYVVDNYTIDDSRANNSVPIGTMIEYVSATSCYVELGEGVSFDEITLKVALTAAADGTAGAVLALANPFGRDVMVDNIVLNITTAPTDTLAGVDAGIAANATTSSDTLIDGAVLATARYYSAHNSPGTNGGANRKMTSSQYITITSVVGSHLDLAAMVGNATVFFKFL